MSNNTPLNPTYSDNHTINIPKPITNIHNPITTLHNTPLNQTLYSYVMGGYLSILINL